MERQPLLIRSTVAVQTTAAMMSRCMFLTLLLKLERERKRERGRGEERETDERRVSK
jgi:hypothetical protein